MENFTVRQDDVELVCHNSGGGGAGPTVVVLHGLAGCAGEFTALAARLSATHRVVAVDQRGHGASTRRPASMSRAAYTADAVAVLETVGPAVLLGQSLGGHTAMLVAAARPDLVRALVLVEAGPTRLPDNVPADIGAWLDSWPVPFPDRSAAEAFLPHPAWAEGLEQRADGLWPRFDRDFMVDSLRENTLQDRWTEWSSITVPTLLIRGAAGSMPAEEVGRMLELRPETVLVEIPGAGHDVHLEAPSAFYEALVDFLTSQSTTDAITTDRTTPHDSTPTDASTQHNTTAATINEPTFRVRD
jgi:pimeloyl-ACP methyl ester carboxylesterase